MPRKHFTESGYSAMWLFVFFDLPVGTKKERKAASKFRKDLLAEGFSMMQLSVYVRFCVNEETAAAHRRTVRCVLPAHGHVRIFGLTDRQFEKMECFVGCRQEHPEERPVQLMFF